MQTTAVSPRPATQTDLSMNRAEVERFLREARVGVLSWTTLKGEVASTPMWFSYREGVFLLHTGREVGKTRAILTNEQVSLLIQDDAPPYRYVSVRGRARVREGAEKAWRLYEEQARAYYGPLTGRVYLRFVRRMRGLSSGAEAGDVIIEVTPTKTTSLDAPRAIGRPLVLALRVARWLGL